MLNTDKPEEIEDIVKESMEIITTLTEENMSLKQANKDLRSKLAEKAAAPERVVIEKVAAEVDEDELQGLLDNLVNTNMLSVGDSVKVASAVKKDPGQLIKIAQRILTISQQSPNTGYGVNPAAYNRSSASSTPSDPDGWWDVVKNGVR